MKKALFQMILPVLAFLLRMAAVAPIQAQEGILTEDFEGAELPGWELTSSARVADGVLRIDGEGYALLPGVRADEALSLRLQVEGEGSIEIRYRLSETGMYILRLSQADVQLIKEIAGEQSVLSQAQVGVPVGEWVLVEIYPAGGRQQVFLDCGIDLLVMEEALLPAGSFMLHVFGEAVGVFDDLTLAPGGGNEQVVGTPQDARPPESTRGAGTISVDSLTWVRTGGPPGGIGYDIRYNFADPDIWYATDLYGGVHISLDDGLTWQPSNTGIPRQAGPSGDAIPIFSLTVDPHDPQIVWAGTDPSGHVYKSTDGGLTWTEKDNGITIEYDGLSLRGFTVDPRSSLIVYAMAETWEFDNVQHGGVVYKTTDGGENWQVIWDGGIPSSLARYMWINPQDPDILYVSTGIFDRGAVGAALDWDTNPDPFGGLGILKSTDGGRSWRILNEDNGLGILYIGSLYMHPEDPDILLAAAGISVPEAAGQRLAAEGHSPLGIYRTTDGGETWAQVLEPAPERTSEVFLSVELCPSDPDIAYAGSDFAFYRSQDAGVSWELVSGGQTWGPPGGIGGFPIDLQCDPQDVNRVFANNYKGGNYLSEDGGRTWTNASTGYTGAQVINVAVDPFDPARVYSVGRNGAWRSEDGGTTWYGIINLAEGQFSSPEWAGLVLDPVRQDRILLGGEGIFESLDGGASWQVHSQAAQFGPFAAVFEFAPSDPSIVYAGAASHNTMIHPESFEGAGLSASRDGGITWQNIAGDQFKDGVVVDLAVSPDDARVVYAATQMGLFKTTDGGASWSVMAGLPAGEPVRAVAIDPADSRTVMAGVEHAGLYLSPDDGLSWQPVSAGLEINASYRDIVYDPLDSRVVYLADLMSGVYRSEDSGHTWLKINTGLTTRAVTSLSLSADGEHLYAGTNGEGVFRLDLNGQPPMPSLSPGARMPTESLAPQEATSSEPADEPGLCSSAILLSMLGLAVWLLRRR